MLEQKQEIRQMRQSIDVKDVRPGDWVKVPENTVPTTKNGLFLMPLPYAAEREVEELKPVLELEPVCWKCGCRKFVHWYDGSHAGCSAYAHDRRKPRNDRRKSNTSMYSRRVGTLEVGASYRYTGSGWDQRGTMEDRRRG